MLCLKVFEKYKSYSPYDMLESITKEVKGDLQKSFLVLGKIIFLINNTRWYFTEDSYFKSISPDSVLVKTLKVY